MASPIKPNRPTSWKSKQEMAAVLDVTIAYFDRAIRPQIRPQHIQRDGRILRFYARGVLDDWYSAKQCNHTIQIESDLSIEEILLLGRIEGMT